MALVGCSLGVIGEQFEEIIRVIIGVETCRFFKFAYIIMHLYIALSDV